MSKFKVGDKVRRITSRFTAGDCTMDIGDTDIVTDVSNNRLQLEHSCPNDYTACDRYFELVEDVKFKVGDTVRVIDDKQYYSTAKHWAKDMDLKNWKSCRTNINNGSIGIIVAMVHERDFTDDPYRYAIKVLGKEYIYNAMGLELMYPKEKLIEIDMDTEDIKNFPKAVLVKAEKQAKKEIAESQELTAVAAFKELFSQIADAEREVKRANAKLKDLRGKAAVAKK